MWWRTGAIALSLAVSATLLSNAVADPDLWGHVLFGQLADTLGWTPRYDPYSYLSHRNG